MIYVRFATLLSAALSLCFIAVVAQENLPIANAARNRLRSICECSELQGILSCELGAEFPNNGIYSGSYGQGVKAKISLRHLAEISVGLFAGCQMESSSGSGLEAVRLIHETCRRIDSKEGTVRVFLKTALFPRIYKFKHLTNTPAYGFAYEIEQARRMRQLNLPFPEVYDFISLDRTSKYQKIFKGTYMTAFFNGETASYSLTLMSDYCRRLWTDQSGASISSSTDELLTHCPSAVVAGLNLLHISMATLMDAWRKGVRHCDCHGGNIMFAVRHADIARMNQLVESFLAIPLPPHGKSKTNFVSVHARSIRLLDPGFVISGIHPESEISGVCRTVHVTQSEDIVLFNRLVSDYFAAGKRLLKLAESDSLLRQRSGRRGSPRSSILLAGSSWSSSSDSEPLRAQHPHIIWLKRFFRTAFVQLRKDYDSISKLETCIQFQKAMKKHGFGTGAVPELESDTNIFDRIRTVASDLEASHNLRCSPSDQLLALQAMMEFTSHKINGLKKMLASKPVFSHPRI